MKTLFIGIAALMLFASPLRGESAEPKWTGEYELQTLPNGTWFMWWEMVSPDGTIKWKLADSSLDPAGILI